MNDVVRSLASQTGVDPDLVQKGLGSILKMLQDHLPEELFSKVQAVLPDAGSMMAASELGEPESRGMLQAVTNLAAKLFGNEGEAAADLFTRLGEHGFSPDQLKSFLPKVLEFLKEKLPADILAKIESIAPGLSKLAEVSEVGAEP
jgi:hypothetical protein